MVFNKKAEAAHAESDCLDWVPKEGSELSEVETVNGEANLNEEHKIELMLIRMDGLWESLSELPTTLKGTGLKA